MKNRSIPDSIGSVQTLLLDAAALFTAACGTDSPEIRRHVAGVFTECLQSVRRSIHAARINQPVPLFELSEGNAVLLLIPAGSFKMILHREKTTPTMSIRQAAAVLALWTRTATFRLSEVVQRNGGVK